MRQRRINYVKQRLDQQQCQCTAASKTLNSVVELLTAVPAVLVPLGTALSRYSPIWVTAIASLATGLLIFWALRSLLPNQPPIFCERCLAPWAKGGSYCTRCGHQRPSDRQRSWGLKQVVLLTAHLLLVLVTGVISLRTSMIVKWSFSDHPVLSLISGCSTLLFIGGLFGLYQWKSDPSKN